MVRLTAVRHHYIEPDKKTQGRNDTPITSYLTLAEMIVFAGLGRLRFGRYVGTVADLYRQLTGRPHPKVRGEAS